MRFTIIRKHKAGQIVPLRLPRAASYSVWPSNSATLVTAAIVLLYLSFFYALAIQTRLFLQYPKYLCHGHTVGYRIYFPASSIIDRGAAE